MGGGASLTEKKCLNLSKFQTNLSIIRIYNLSSSEASHKQECLGGLRPPSIKLFKIHPSSRPVHLECWVQNRPFLKNWNWNKNKLKNKKIHFRTLRIFWHNFFFSQLVKFLTTISLKTKNRKSDFSFVSEHCTTFWNKKPIW